MEDYVKKVKSRQGILRVIGAFEIFGGILGLYGLRSVFLNVFDFPIINIIVFFSVVLFCVFSIFAGWKLIVDMEKSILYSQIVQYFQIFAISFGGATYLLTLGSNLFLGFDIEAYSLTFNFKVFGGEIQLFVEGSAQGNYVKINILAIVVLTFIEKAKKTIELNKERRKNYLKRMEN